MHIPDHVIIALNHADKAIRCGNLDNFDRWMKAAERYAAITDRLKRIVDRPKPPKFGVRNPV